MQFNIGDIVIFDYYQKSNGERIEKTGQIVYLSNTDNTANVKCHLSNTIVNVGCEILRLHILPDYSKDKTVNFL
jgi:hypothetical protein